MFRPRSPRPKDAIWASRESNSGIEDHARCERNRSMLETRRRRGEQPDGAAAAASPARERTTPRQPVRRSDGTAKTRRHDPSRWSRHKKSPAPVQAAGRRTGAGDFVTRTHRTRAGSGPADERLQEQKLPVGVGEPEADMKRRRDDGRGSRDGPQASDRCRLARVREEYCMEAG